MIEGLKYYYEKGEQHIPLIVDFNSIVSNLDITYTLEGSSLLHDGLFGYYHFTQSAYVLDKNIGIHYVDDNAYSFKFTFDYYFITSNGELKYEFGTNEGNSILFVYPISKNTSSMYESNRIDYTKYYTLSFALSFEISEEYAINFASENIHTLNLNS